MLIFQVNLVVKQRQWAGPLFTCVLRMYTYVRTCITIIMLSVCMWDLVTVAVIVTGLTIIYTITYMYMYTLGFNTRPYYNITLRLVYAERGRV